MDFESDQNIIEAPIEKPLKLYRGYIPGEETVRRSSTEKGLIEKIIQIGDDPHSEKYADKLIWTTPDEKYAGVVTMSRALVDMALDPEYKESVLVKGERLPSVDEYSLPSDTKMYDAKGNKIKPLNEGETSSQILVDNIEDADIKTKKITKNALRRLNNFLADSKDNETFLKPSMIIEINTGFSYLEDRLKEKGKEAFAMTFEEGVRDMWQYYNSKGVTLSEFRELMGKGLLGMTSLTLSSTFNFE